MINYKICFKILLVICFAVNLFADETPKYIEQNEDDNIAYLGLRKEVPKSYRITGKFKKDNKYNEPKYTFSEYSLTGDEKIFKSKSKDKKYNSYEVNGIFSMNNFISKRITPQYNITGDDKTFSSDKEFGKTYNVNGVIKNTKKVSVAKKNSFTKYQKAQIDYLEMERKYKIATLDKEIFIKKKMLDEELTNDFSDAFLIEELSNDIKILAADKETVNINVDKKLNYILGSEQYLKYKQKQNKKNKKKI